MELSFPCAGNIDDGVFNIDLEEGDDSSGDGRQWHATPACDSGVSSLLDLQHSCQSKLLSPDALDLALMAFDVTASEEEDEEEGEGGAVSNNTRDAPLSPFCDATIHQRGMNSAATRRIRLDEAHTIPLDYTGFSALWGTTGTKDRCSTPSPGAVPMGWPSAKAHRGGFSKASPPKLTVVGHDGPSNLGTRLIQEHRGVGEAWRRFPSHQPFRRLITDVHAQSRWARERAETREAVASSVRKEEKALSAANRVPVACLNGMTGVQTETDSVEKKRVSFVDDVDCGSLSLPSPGTRDATSQEDRNEKSQTGAPAQEKEKEEVLARASKLHSSVAGQLRSVNELLRRKSYFYIDTSWSARQLPYPPTAWKNPASDGHGEGGVGIDANVNCRITPSADRNQPAILSDANGVLRLDGRWVAAGSKKPNVGFYSIPGKKVSKTLAKNTNSIGAQW